MRALLPPSSNKCLPKRPVTVMATLRPTGVLPVNETNLILLSSAIDWPISVPPWQREQMAPGNPFFSRTWAIILVVATDTKGVVGAPFQIIEFPQTMAMALFHPYTATYVKRGSLITSYVNHVISYFDISFHLTIFLSFFTTSNYRFSIFFFWKILWCALFYKS